MSPIPTKRIGHGKEVKNSQSLLIAVKDIFRKMSEIGCDVATTFVEKHRSFNSEMMEVIEMLWNVYCSNQNFIGKRFGY